MKKARNDAVFSAYIRGFDSPRLHQLKKPGMLISSVIPGFFRFFPDIYTSKKSGVLRVLKGHFASAFAYEMLVILPFFAIRMAHLP